jgi:ABC-type transport system involved in multi-copper enzyme maturation permease subunit
MANGITEGLNRRHVGLIARFWARFAIRTGGGLVFLLVLLVSGLSIAGLFITPAESVVANPEIRQHDPSASAGKLTDEVLRTDQVRDIVKWITGANDEEATYLLRENPALLSAILLVLLMAFPYLACFGAFNQTSGDIQSKGLRYLLLRTERANIFLGRFIGAFLFTLVSTAFLVLLVVLYIGLKLQVYPAGALVAWGLQGYLALVLLGLPYVAMCSWISGAIDSPFGALVLCLLLVGFPVMFLSGAAAVAHGDANAWLRILPWGWKYDLLSMHLHVRLIAVCAMAAFTGIFLWIGMRIFSRRDL